MTEQRRLSFTVDTHLLRELGALLVGRDSTALLELVKNSYDASASEVVVHASRLAEEDAYIAVTDNGTGMTFHTFEDAFLRIAGRSKEVGDRLSPRYRRRYTGAKGIGRLAAHKLARELEVRSVPADEVLGDGPDELVGVEALMDWEAMETEHSDLGSLGDSLVATPLAVTAGVPRGTSLSLRKLRGTWSRERIAQFVSEVQSSQVPNLLLKQPTNDILGSELLLSDLTVRQTDSSDPGFTVELTGDLAHGEEFWRIVAARSEWVLEIDSAPSGITYGIGPTRRKLDELARDPNLAFDSSAAPLAENRTYDRPHPDPANGPFFQARILVSEGSLGRKRELRTFERAATGIRVYLEGFRVLPYGSPGDDWLRIDADYVRKSREFETPLDVALPPVSNEGYVQLGNRAYYGAVALTEQGTPLLRALVNREGFVQDEYFALLAQTVRTGVDLVTRTRAALGDRVKAAVKRKELAELDSEMTTSGDVDADYYKYHRAPSAAETDLPASDNTRAAQGSPTLPSSAVPSPADQQERRPDSGELETLIDAAVEAAQTLRSNGGIVEAPAAQRSLEWNLSKLAVRLRDQSSEHANLRSLASVGTQFSAFVHEINGLLAQAQTLVTLVNTLASDPDLNRTQRRKVREVSAAAADLAASLQRQASYLVDIVGPDARRRRSRLPVRQRIESATRLLAGRIAARKQRLQVDIPESLHTPPIFPAELTILVTNLLSNAIKFAGGGGHILISGSLDSSGTLEVTVSNTGAAVATTDRERFFRPFESTTTEVDPLLGQGMGLGLPIVRSLAEDYNGEARFIDPPQGFATAVQVTFPDPRPGLAKTE